MVNIEHPSDYSYWMDLAMNLSDKNKELAICGKSALQYCNKINSLYVPNIVLAGTEKKLQYSFFKKSL